MRWSGAALAARALHGSAVAMTGHCSGYWRRSPALRPRAALVVALVLSACSEDVGRRGGLDAPHVIAADVGLADRAVATADAPPPDAAPPAHPDECQQMESDWVFCSSFEEGDKSPWDDYDGNPDEENQLVADPGPLALATNHVIRLRVPPGRGGADLVKLLPSQHDRLYARWYVKWEPGFDFSAPNHGSGLFAGDRNLLGRSGYRPDGSDRFGATVEHRKESQRLNLYAYYRGMYQDCADPAGSCWGDHLPCMIDEGKTYCTKPHHRETVLPPVMQADRWYCIELMVDGGTPVSSGAQADGQMNFWVDGQQIGPWTDLWLRTTAKLKLNILWLSLFHHAEHSTAGMLFDNVVVSKQRIGCLGS